MDSSRVFRVIWRINALLILGAGLMLAATLVFTLYRIGQDVFRPRQVSRMVSVDPGVRPSTEWDLGEFRPVEGTDYLVAPVYSAQTYRASYYEKDTSAVRNYLFVNAVDKTSRWLVPHNDYLFVSAEQLIWPRRDSGGSEVRWIWYQVVKADTSGDGRLTSDDRRTVAIADGTGAGYAELVPDVEKILGATVRGEDALLLFYRSGGQAPGQNSGKNLISEIALAERRVTVTKELPEIQP